jgi:hypothetical protein
MNSNMAANMAINEEGFRQWQAQSRLLEQVQVVFIVGPPKCGTTWVMQALNGHPNVIARGESAIARALVPHLTAAFRAYNQHQKTFGGKPHTMFGDQDFMHLLRQTLDRQLIQYVATGKPLCGNPLMAVMDKSPAHSQHIDLLASLYPRAKFICCVRDVRDAAVSGWFHFSPQGWLKQKTIDEYARVFAEQTWAPMLRDARASAAKIGAARYREIEYADHKSDPAHEMRALLDFVGLPATTELVNACLEAGDFRKVTGGRVAGDEDRQSFFRKGVVGDWSNHMDAALGAELLSLANAVLSGQQTVQVA